MEAPLPSWDWLQEQQPLSGGNGCNGARRESAAGASAPNRRGRKSSNKTPEYVLARLRAKREGEKEEVHILEREVSRLTALAARLQRQNQTVELQHMVLHVMVSEQQQLQVIKQMQQLGIPPQQPDRALSSSSDGDAAALLASLASSGSASSSDDGSAGALHAMSGGAARAPGPCCTSYTIHANCYKLCRTDHERSLLMGLEGFLQTAPRLLHGKLGVPESVLGATLHEMAVQGPSNRRTESEMELSSPLMCMNLATGVLETASQEACAACLAALRLTASQVQFLGTLYQSWLEATAKLIGERRQLVSRLQALQSWQPSCQSTAGAEWLDQVMLRGEYERVLEAIEANIKQEETLSHTVCWAGTSRLDPMQYARGVVAWWPYFPSALTTLSLIHANYTAQ